MRDPQPILDWWGKEAAALPHIPVIALPDYVVFNPTNMAFWMLLDVEVTRNPQTTEFITVSEFFISLTVFIFL